MEGKSVRGDAVLQMPQAEFVTPTVLGLPFIDEAGDWEIPAHPYAVNLGFEALVTSQCAVDRVMQRCRARPP